MSWPISSTTPWSPISSVRAAFPIFPPMAWSPGWCRCSSIRKRSMPSTKSCWKSLMCSWPMQRPSWTLPKPRSRRAESSTRPSWPITTSWSAIPSTASIPANCRIPSCWSRSRHRPFWRASTSSLPWSTSLRSSRP